jgi:DNA-binding response OmpR family regulator
MNPKILLVEDDIERRKVKCLSDDDSNPDIDLTATEFDLLVMLAKSPGRVFSRNALMDQVWGQDYYGVDRTVDTHMSRLRRKLGTCGDHIQTVHGVGYRFKA